MPKLLKLLWDHMEEALSALLLAIMVTISFVNVLSRYFANLSIAFTEELTIYLFVWMTILGISLAFRTGSNMVVNFFNNLFPKKARRVIYIFSTLLTVVFFAVLAYMGIIEVSDEIMMQAMTESMHLPIWYFTVSVPVGACLIIVRAVIKAAQTLREGTY